MKRNINVIGVLLLFVLLLATPAVTMAQGDFGDAPEGAIAYPWLGIPGAFPTCVQVGPAGWIFHAPGSCAWLGGTVDWEPDGNGGTCTFPPYDQDECSPSTDPDAGLTHPTAYTIVGGVVVPCSQETEHPLGQACTVATWGTPGNIDLRVANNCPTEMYLNVLMDWDQSGTWGGGSPCPLAFTQEWVLQNFIVPPGFVGLLSALGPPGFLIGPNGGYVWCRFTLCDMPITNADWDGSGEFGMGESEDYLLRVRQEGLIGDYGDAPEGAIAYPGLGIMGAFPTCTTVGPATWVYHGLESCGWFGPLVDNETDGNAGSCLFPPYDQDECSPSTDTDAGLIIPDAFTISGGAVVPCGEGVRPLGRACNTAVWGTPGNIDIQVTNYCPHDLFVNVLLDWDQSGTWGGKSPCPLANAPEWVLRNFIVPPGYSGPLSALGPAPFLIGPNPGYVWCRFTLTETALTADDWDGSGEFAMGESEDYLLHVLREEDLGEYGDAPEGAIAYPSLGINGAFPTCIYAGPSGWVYHAPEGCCWFGPNVDFEVDGNAGNCVFPLYDQDECSNTVDVDAGLTVPDAYTIVGGVEVLCDPSAIGRALGGICMAASWGPAGNIDILVNNICTSEKYVNVVMDWDQSGTWGGWSQCPGGLTAPEWVLVNLVVPAGYAGPLSALGPAPFLIGPRLGFVWCRFTISDVALAVEDWDGSGSFATGESEDYLLRVENPPENGEYGDAPEQAPAYPYLGVTGQFPTCVLIGPPTSYVYHGAVPLAWFGPSLDYEADGNAGTCIFPPYNQDECRIGDGDAGLIVPEPFTINVAGAIVPCPPGPGTRPNLGWYCVDSHWGANLDLRITNNSLQVYFVNILADWDQNGVWSGAVQCPGGMVLYPEHLLVNLPVPAGFAGRLSDLITGPFMVPAQPGFVWIRCTISDRPVPPGWDGSGTFDSGETEDYLVRVEDTQSSIPGPGRPAGVLGLVLEPSNPNPFNPTTSVAFRLDAAGIVRVTVTDIAGRVVRVLADRVYEPGRHTLAWDGTDDRGVVLGSGLYFVRAEAGGVVRTQKTLIAR